MYNGKLQSQNTCKEKTIKIKIKTWPKKKSGRNITIKFKSGN